MRIKRRAWCVRIATPGAVLLLGLALPGCGDSESGSVSGQVRFNGALLPSGTVTFYGANNLSASAPIAADGGYTATKVPVGPVKVTVTTPPPVSEGGKKAFEKMRKGATASLGGETVAIPPRYGTPDQSGLELTVTSGSQVYEIDLK
jgi:hypothetical protein